MLVRVVVESEVDIVIVMSVGIGFFVIFDLCSGVVEYFVIFELGLFFFV